MTEILKKYWPLLPALAAYALLTQQLNFIQDDAYISYRYVANFLNGDGLVYNIGERVEGFTNFGWVILMIQCGAFGLDFIFWSQVIGFLFGAGIIVLSFVVARSVLDDLLASAVATLLVGANMSLAYWAPAGLETAAFGFFAMLALYCYLRRSYWLIWALLMAVWIRPEGGLVALLLLIVETIQERRLPKFSLTCGVGSFILSLPFVGFKLMYYGSILPNPFYAKTGLGVDQLSSGLEYIARFLQHYGFWGVGCLVPILLFRKLSNEARALWLFTIFYVIYIGLVGGDVLKSHRFFVPLIGPFAILLLLSLRLLTEKFKTRIRSIVIASAGCSLVVATYVLPLEFVTFYNEGEKLFTEKMGTLAQHMRESDTTRFSVALPTIGVFGYELMGHEIIDMLGLTDSTVARHSVEPIAGMETTWKERSHNSAYILKRQPDYIIFSTGMKPSAPAEKALLLYPQFMDCYRTVSWYTQLSGASEGTLKPAYKRVRPILEEPNPTYPLEFVDQYKSGLEYANRGDFKKAIGHYNRALKSTDLPPYIYLAYNKAHALMMTQEPAAAMRLLDAVVNADSTVFEAHRDLYMYAVFSDDSAKAAIHERWLRLLVPWYVDRVISNVAGMVARSEGK